MKEQESKRQRQRRRNPVARHAGRYNRCDVFRDRSKYRRDRKHKGRDSYPMGTQAACASDRNSGL